MITWGFAVVVLGFGTIALLLSGWIGWLLRGEWEKYESPGEKSRRNRIMAKWAEEDPWKHYAGTDYPHPMSSTATSGEEKRWNGPPPRFTGLEPAETPVQRETSQTGAIFQAKSGQSIESPHTWDKRLERFGGPATIPYEELEGMFLDQFLLRYFHSLMPQISDGWPGEGTVWGGKPWDMIQKQRPWIKEMPILFEQLSGQKLNEIQLNNAIAEWARRVSKPPIPIAGVE